MQISPKTLLAIWFKMIHGGLQIRTA
uniref:Uncharacterized protein n=1 Tax=Arundo donax TaxID=35708 RepID=A0A0A9EA69_ARUDO